MYSRQCYGESRFERIISVEKYCSTSVPPMPPVHCTSDSIDSISSMIHDGGKMTVILKKKMSPYPWLVSLEKLYLPELN